jgi:hypothetical protein
MSAALELSFSGLLLCAARLAGEAGQLRGGRLLRRTIAPPPTPQEFIGEHRLNAAPVRCSVAAMVASRSAVNCGSELLIFVPRAAHGRESNPSPVIDS